MYSRKDKVSTFHGSWLLHLKFAEVLNSLRETLRNFPSSIERSQVMG